MRLPKRDLPPRNRRRVHALGERGRPNARYPEGKQYPMCGGSGPGQVWIFATGGEPITCGLCLNALDRSPIRL